MLSTQRYNCPCACVYTAVKCEVAFPFNKNKVLSWCTLIVEQVSISSNCRVVNWLTLDLQFEVISLYYLSLGIYSLPYVTSDH